VESAVATATVVSMGRGNAPESGWPVHAMHKCAVSLSRTFPGSPLARMRSRWRAKRKRESGKSGFFRGQGMPPTSCLGDQLPPRRIRIGQVEIKGASVGAPPLHPVSLPVLPEQLLPGLDVVRIERLRIPSSRVKHRSRAGRNFIA